MRSWAIFRSICPFGQAEALAAVGMDENQREPLFGNMQTTLDADLNEFPSTVIEE